MKKRYKHNEDLFLLQAPEYRFCIFMTPYFLVNIMKFDTSSPVHIKNIVVFRIRYYKVQKNNAFLLVRK